MGLFDAAVSELPWGSGRRRVRMRWSGGRRSTNIGDRRGMRPGLVGGGLGGIILTLIALYFGVDPGAVVNSREPVADSSGGPIDDRDRDFVSTVVGYTE